jgi:hypothetical protein
MANSSGIQQDGDFAATWKSVAKREKSNHRLSSLQSASTLRTKKAAKTGGLLNKLRDPQIDGVSKTQSPKTGSPTSTLGLDAVKAPSGINPFSVTAGFSCNTTSR